MASLSEAFSAYGAVVVTGGSSGIGKSFIELMGKLCPELVIFNLSRRVPDIKGSQLNLRHVACDLSESAPIEAAASRLEEALTQGTLPGRILLINNSGFGSYGPFPEPGPAHQLGMIDVNVRGLVHLTVLLLPLLRARGGPFLDTAPAADFQPIHVIVCKVVVEAILMLPPPRARSSG